MGRHRLPRWHRRVMAASLSAVVLATAAGSGGLALASDHHPTTTVKAAAWHKKKPRHRHHAPSPSPSPHPSGSPRPSPPGTPSPAPTTAGLTPSPTPQPTTSSASAASSPTPTASPTTTPSGSLRPTWDPSGTNALTFDDEFNGTSLSSKWENGWFGGSQPVNSFETACYQPDHATVSGGTLNLNLLKEQTCSGKPWTGALVDTRLGFNQYQGEFEARVYLPDDGHGNAAGWPAWWLNGPDSVPWPQHGEIDVVEGLSGSPETAAHVHYTDNGDMGWTAPTGMTGWHDFGVKWGSGSATFYWDGKAVYTHAFPPQYAEYLIFDYTMESDSHLPVGNNATMKVDWVRAWK